jgi:hypothetical protein
VGTRYIYKKKNLIVAKVIIFNEKKTFFPSYPSKNFTKLPLLRSFHKRHIVTGKGVIERGTCLWFLRCEGQFCFKGLRVKPAENWFNDGGGIYAFGEVRMATVHG